MRKFDSDKKTQESKKIFFSSYHFFIGTSSIATVGGNAKLTFRLKKLTKQKIRAIK